MLASTCANGLTTESFPAATAERKEEAISEGQLQLQGAVRIVQQHHKGMGDLTRYSLPEGLKSGGDPA